MTYWESFKKKIFGEPLEDGELDELLEEHKNLSKEEKEKIEDNERQSYIWLILILPIIFFLKSCLNYFQDQYSLYDILDNESFIFIFILPIIVFFGVKFFNWKNIGGYFEKPD